MKLIRYIFLLLICYGSYSQELTLPMYKQYGTKEGLPQQQVMSLFEDSRGYIWAGTKRGVARFNGETFTSFSSKNGFPLTYIEKIIEDETGKVWVLSYDGIAYFNGDSYKAFPFPNGYSTARFDITQSPPRYFLLRRAIDDEFFIATFNGKDFELSQPLLMDKTLDYHYQYHQKENKLYFISTEKLYTFDTQGNKLSESLGSGQSHWGVSKKVENTNFFITNEQDKIFRVFKFHSDTLELIGLYQNDNWEIPFPEELKEGVSYFGANRKTFLQNGEVKHIDLKNQFLNAEVLDKNGVQWFGSESGLIRMFSPAFTAYNSSVFPEIWGVTESPKGKIWTSSYSFGIKTLQNEKVTNEIFLDHEGKLGRDYYFHPVEGSGGTIYFPYWNGVIKRLPNGKTKILKSTWQRDGICLYTFYDKQRKLLVGGFRKSIAFWNDNDQLVKVIGQKEGEELLGFALSIAKDSVGKYWFGSRGISSYDWDKNEFKKYEYPDQTEPFVCVDIAVDYSGQVWFATQQGLYFLNPKTDALQKIDVPQLQGVVSAVIASDPNRLLVSQPNGLYVLDLQEFYKSGEIHLSLYNEANGFLGEEAGQAGMFKDSEGKIWITGKVLSRLDPDLLPAYQKPKLNLVFKRFNNTPIGYDFPEIKLPDDETSATIVFDAVATSSVMPIWFSYQTNKKTWSEPQKENYLTLTDLPHGKTTLRLRSWFENEGENSAQEFTIDIWVSKAFYNQAWFLPLVIFVLLLTIAVIWYVYKRTQNQLEKTIMRAKISEVETIQSQMNPHFVYNVLANVQTKIRSFKTDEAETLLLNLAELIRRFLHTSTDTIIEKGENLQIQNHLVTLLYELNLLQEFIDFQQILYPDTFDYRLTISDEVDLNHTFIPPMILQPFVENAISHGLIPKEKSGTLHISILKQADKTAIIITDDGIGIEKSQQIQQKSKLRYPSRGRKLTLQRIELLKELGFRISVKTQSSENGTSITLVFG